MPTTPAQHTPTKQRGDRKREKKERKEKEQITSIFSSQIR